jgi:ABC-type multidrug transport system ATPase subunit
MRKNAAVILVTHDMNQVARMCNLVLVLNKGRVAYFGESKAGVERYYAANETGDDAEGTFEKWEAPAKSAVVKVAPEVCPYGGHLDLQITIDTAEAVPNALLHVVFYNSQEQICAEWNSKRNEVKVEIVAGQNNIRLKVGPVYLMNGRYRLGLGIHDATGVGLLLWSYKRHCFSVKGPIGGLTDFQMPTN